MNKKLFGYMLILVGLFFSLPMLTVYFDALIRLYTNGVKVIDLVQWDESNLTSAFIFQVLGTFISLFAKFEFFD